MTEAVTELAEPKKSTPGFAGVPTLIARLIVGGIFVKYGLSKIGDPHLFLKSIESYKILPLDPPTLINSIGVILPWIEIVIGVLLILGLARRGGATISFVMLIFFTAAIANLGYDYHLKNPNIALTAIKLDCGCGGGPVNVALKLLTNSGLILLSAFLMRSSSHRFTFKPGG